MSDKLSYSFRISASKAYRKGLNHFQGSQSGTSSMLTNRPAHITNGNNTGNSADIAASMSGDKIPIITPITFPVAVRRIITKMHFTKFSA